MNLYAVALTEDREVWVEFYRAEDVDHALEQAIDAHPTLVIPAVAVVPLDEQPSDDVQFLLDGLGVTSIVELKGMVDAVRGEDKDGRKIVLPALAG